MKYTIVINNDLLDYIDKLLLLKLIFNRTNEKKLKNLQPQFSAKSEL